MILTQLGSPRAADTDMRVVRAAEGNDARLLRTLVTAGADVRAVGVDGSSPLLWAAHHANLEATRLLIAARADVNAANRYGVTPLLEASRLGNLPIIELLVQAGADVTVSQPEGETPLMAAAAAGSADAVRLFIAHGARVDAREAAQDQTALMWAAGEGHLAVVQALLEAGADPNAMGRVTALPRLRGDGGRMWVDYTSGGLTPLMFAARQGNVAVARALADAGADLNHANPDGLTPMLIAVLNDQLDMAAALLDKGANPNDGSLFEAVQVHNLRTNETVGEATRPRPDHANTLTPLDLIARMLDRGADPMKLATHTLHADSTGQPQAANQSAFARALQAQDIGVLTLLVAKGADVNLAGAAGTPLMTLMAGGGRFGGGFGAAPAAFRFPGQRSAADAVNLLLAAGADVNGAGENGDTALHLAAQSGNVAMIQLLADNGANLEARNSGGYTPLDAAMGKRAPGGAPPARGGFGPPGRGGPPQPQPQAIVLLRQLMGLPPLAPGERPESPAPGGRGGV